MPAPAGGPLAVIVLAHRNPDQVADLLGRLTHPRVRIYFHLDARTPADPFRREIASRAPGADLSWLPRRPSLWGGIEVVDATLEGMRRALADGCAYVVLVSGQDLPVWPVEEIVDFYRERADRTFLEFFALPDERWRLGGRYRTDFYTFTLRGRRETHVPRPVDVAMSWKGRVLNELLGLRVLSLPPRRFPGCARPFGGSQWWNMSTSAVRWVLDFLESNPGYRRYHEHTLLPDELFFQSILAGTAFADEHALVNDSLRFVTWEAGARHPRTLGVRDLPGILASGKPFARKFDPAVDAEVMRRLPLRRSGDVAVEREGP